MALLKATELHPWLRGLSRSRRPTFRCRHTDPGGLLIHRSERLDEARGLDHADGGSVVGIELLSPRRKGVILDGLPYPDDVDRVIGSAGFRVLRTTR